VIDAGTKDQEEDPYVLTISTDVSITVTKQGHVSMYRRDVEPGTPLARPYRGTISVERFGAFRRAIVQADVCGTGYWGDGIPDVSIRSTLPDLCDVDVADSKSRAEQRRRFNAVMKAVRQLQRDVCQGRCAQGLNGF
jgi:hypothetical protein